MTAKDWVAVVQVLASWALVCIAFVTLNRASKTLLQPLRTEAFKAQLEELRNLLRFLAGRDELQLRELFGLDQLVKANAVWIHDRFMRDVYHVIIDAAERPYAAEKCPFSMVRDEALTTHPEFATHPARGQVVAVATFKSAATEDPRAWWLRFNPEELKIPAQLTQSLDCLRDAAASPLMPAPIVQCVKELISAVDSNTRLLFEVLALAGRELPARFPTATAPETFTVGWVADRFYGRLNALEPRVVALNKAVRDHLAIDALMKPW